MGLDMRPLGKPKPGFEKRLREIYDAIMQAREERLPTPEGLMEEWSANVIQSYETIRAPRVGYDEEADAWAKAAYEESDKDVSLEEFVAELKGYYVILLAKEEDGIPLYMSYGQDENVFRGEFLSICEDILDKDLIGEAWTTKLADEALDYGYRLQKAADAIAIPQNLQYLKDQRDVPETEEETLEVKLHIVYSLARWLIFYGKNGHGYEANW